MVFFSKINEKKLCYTLNKVKYETNPIYEKKLNILH